MLRPSGDVAKFWDDYATARAQRRETVARSQQEVAVGLAFWIGDPDQAPRILEAIDVWRNLSDSLGPDDPAVVEQRLRVEGMLAESGGALAQRLAEAEAYRWIKLMQARAEVFKHTGQLAAYRAAPQLYAQREIMRTLSEKLVNRRKFILVGVDTRRFNVEIKLEETPSLFSFDDALPGEGGSGQ